jgi:hypothetical protein
VNDEESKASVAWDSSIHIKDSGILEPLGLFNLLILWKDRIRDSMDNQNFVEIGTRGGTSVNSRNLILKNIILLAK